MTLGVGCVSLGSAGAGRSTGGGIRLVHEALDLGIRVFDTADAYGNGASESVLGAALRGRRDAAFLATKGGYVFRERTPGEQRVRRIGARVLRQVRRFRRSGGATGRSGGGSYSAQDFSPRHLRSAIEGSLRRLRTDRIDRYQLHGPPALMPDLLAELVDLRQAGKILSFGIGAEDVGSAVPWLDEPAIEGMQIPFGVLDPEAAEVLFPRLDQRPTDIWARGVLGGGLLAVAARDPDALAADPKAPQVAALYGVAATTGLGIDELAVAFVRSFTEVSTILVGTGSSEHLRRNVGLFAAPLPDRAVVAQIRAVAEGGDRSGRA